MDGLERRRVMALERIGRLHNELNEREKQKISLADEILFQSFVKKCCYISSRGEDLLDFNIPKRKRGDGQEILKKPEACSGPIFRNSPSQEETELAEMMMIKNKNKKMKKVKSKRIKFQEVGLYPPPEIPTELRKRIEEELSGTDLQLVIMKQIFDTDLKTGHNRLSIPEKQVMCDFLYDTEKQIVSNKEGFIPVSVIEPCGDINSKIKFGRWKMTNTFIYTLYSDWNRIFQKKANEEFLKEGAVIQVYSYRDSEQKLCFAVVNVRKADDDNDDAAADFESSAAAGDGASSSHSTVTTVVD